MLKGIFSLKIIEFRSRRDMRNHLVQPSLLKVMKPRKEKTCPRSYSSKWLVITPSLVLVITPSLDFLVKYQESKSFRNLK